MNNPKGSGFHGTLADHSEEFSSTDWLRNHHDAKASQRADFARSLALPKAGKILDVACGVGGWSWTFADQYPSCEVIGFDTSHTNLEAARAAAHHAGSISRPTFVAADVQRLPFREESFDVVFVSNCLQFKRFEAAVPRLYSLLRKGGRLILRNFDEGMTMLYPCRPELYLSVLAAVARTLKAEAREDPIDAYVGRRLKSILRRSFSEPIRFEMQPTRLEFPFTPAQRAYIAGNADWLAAAAGERLDRRARNEWATNFRLDGGMFYADRSAYYVVVDFCAQLTRAR